MANSILIKNADWVVTLNEQDERLQHMDVGVKDGKIAFLQAHGQPLPVDFAPDTVIDGRGQILAPGLVNAHCHTPMTLLRDYGNDMPLMPWLGRMNALERCETLTDDDIRWGCRLAHLEMIRSGITCFADMYAWSRLLFEVTAETGLRANIGGQYGPEAPEPFSERVPQLRKHLPVWHKSHNGRLRETVVVHAIYTVSEPDIHIAIEAAKELGAGIQIHISEDGYQEGLIKEKHNGKSTLQVLHDWGMLDVPVIAAHCIHLSEEDYALMREKGVSAVHCPSSNMLLANGFANVPRLLQEGVTTALGTDGAASNNNLNLFEEMHLAALIHKGVHRDPVCMDAGEAFRMATINGAKALGFERVGSIRPGWAADLMLVDCTVPHATPCHDPISTLVYTLQASDVRTVIADGRILMQDRVLTGMEEEEVLFHVREAAERICR